MEKMKEVDIKHKPLDITPTPQILQLLENLAVDPWRCVAELIDNSLDDFRRNGSADGRVTVNVEGSTLIVEDNGSGMSHVELGNALRAGYSSKSKVGELGLFGIGFNVACARLGRKATIITKRIEDNHWTKVIVDINQLKRDNSFLVTPVSIDLEKSHNHGTMVIIELHKEHLADFSRPRYLAKISEDLGRCYSFILRDSVPGLTGEHAGSPRPIEIIVGGVRVQPWLPCIWSEARSVQYKGNDVAAVKKFERQLPDAAICENCGKRNASSAVHTCDSCGSSNIIRTSRRVWGWIGVQRYLDRLEFGLNFIRNGRTIQFRNQDIFTFYDPSSGEIYKDYPVEWPADMGRIVGEVHCDHVPVDFIKTHFDKDDQDWLGVLDIIRGTSSLQPRRATGRPNSSPLAEIFNAYRINEPGTRYLIPGNGRAAIHAATKNWAQKFGLGDPMFLQDDHWFKAAEAHDRGEILSESPGTPTSSPTVSPVRSISAPSSSPLAVTHPAVGAVIGSTNTMIGTGASSPKLETINQKMARWELGGVERFDLAKSITPAAVGKTYTLTAWETYSEILTDDGKTIPALALPVSGNVIKLYAYKKDQAFIRFGRNTTDLLLMEAAQQIKILSGSSAPLSQIFVDILSNFPDEEKSESVVRSKILEMEHRLQTRISPIISKNSLQFWSYLSSESRIKAEENAVSSRNTVVWEDAIKSGEFASYLPLSGIRELVLSSPEKLFDGVMFRQHYATAHAESARQRVSSYVDRALLDIDRIRNLNVTLNAYELETAYASITFLNDSISDGK